MKLKIPLSVIVISVFIFAVTLNVAAQFNAQIGATFGNRNKSLINSLLVRLTQNTPGKASKNNSTVSAAVKFNPPAGGSGVPQLLADSLGENAEQRQALAQGFDQIKQAYEAEAAKEGKSNNLAAAMTFFIAANVATYGQTDLASEEAGEKLFQSLLEAMTGVPAFAEMTDAEKHKMHDWLVCMGGFALTNYLDAKQSGDAQALANIKAFADYSLRLVLGIEASKLSLSPNGLNIRNDSSGSNAASPSASNKIVGTWRKKSAVANSNLVTNAGYHVSEYVFNANGTYTFKSEMWLGYLRSEEWRTTEETGAFAVDESSVTVSPRRSITILRTRNGEVLKTQNNPLEAVTYNYKFHYFEGLKETQLILQTSAETRRDGGFSATDSFPNSYLYDQSSIIEWKF